MAVDVTGILAASLLAGLGLFVLPNKRRQAKRDFHDRAEELEARLVEVMREQFEHELARSTERVREAIAPYTRFVRTQSEHLEQMRAELSAVDNDMRALRHEIGGRQLPAGERVASLPRPAALWTPRGLEEPTLDDIIEAELVELPPPSPETTPAPRPATVASRPERDI